MENYQPTMYVVSVAATPDARRNAHQQEADADTSYTNAGGGGAANTAADQQPSRWHNADDEVRFTRKAFVHP